MSKAPVAEPQYEEGKVYLRDKRNGRLHEYQELLAGMSYMERIVYSKEAMEQEKRSVNIPVFKSSAQERAADFDRLASMKPEDREAELKRRADYEEEQKKLKEYTDNVPTETRQLVMTEKAAGVSYEAYKKKDWTDEQLIAEGLAEYQ